MKSKVVATYLSLFFTTLSVALIVISYCQNYKLLENIGFSILGSALISLVISLSEYFAIKRETMEAAYLAASRFNTLISNIKYLHLGDKEKVLIKYISEKKQNEKWAPLGLPQSHESYDAIVAFYSLNGCSDTDILQFLQKEEESFKARIRDVAQSVSLAAECGSDDLSHSFGRVKYLCDCFKIKSHRKAQIFYDRVYKPLYDMDLFLHEINGAFQRYYEYKEDNIAMTIAPINKLNDRLFEVTENESLHEIRVCSSFYSEMRNRVEEFRCSIYRHEKFEPIPKQIVSCMINKPVRAPESEENNAKG